MWNGNPSLSILPLEVIAYILSFVPQPPYIRKDAVIIKNTVIISNPLYRGRIHSGAIAIRTVMLSKLSAYEQNGANLFKLGCAQPWWFIPVCELKDQSSRIAEVNSNILHDLYSGKRTIESVLAMTSTELKELERKSIIKIEKR